MATRALWTLDWVFCLLLIEQIIAMGPPKAKFEVVSVEHHSDDEDKVKLDLRVHRVKREGYALSGTIDIKYDINNNNTIEAIFYHSQNGIDYQLLPGNMKKQNCSDFMEQYYETYWYENFKDCSNSPEPKDIIPMPQMVYKFDACSLKNVKGFPNVYAEGFYKFVVSVRGEVYWEFIVVGKFDFKYT